MPRTSYLFMISATGVGRVDEGYYY